VPVEDYSHIMLGYEVMVGDSRGVNGDDEGKENPLS
jgi:hypothetical protein